MIPETYYIKDIGKSELAIMPKPRGNDWLEDEVSGLRQLGYNVVVSFLTEPESVELGVDDEERLCEKNGIEFISFPMIDREVPDESAFIEQVSRIHRKVNQGDKAIIHCRGGIGRAGITAVAVLIMDGMDGQEAFELVSDARGIEVPDTEEQKQFVLAMVLAMVQTLKG